MAILNLTYDSADQEIQKLVAATKEEALREFSPAKFDGAYPKDGFGIGELRPKELGLSNNYWQGSVTTSFADWINKNLGTDVYLVITGVFNLTVAPMTTELAITANGQDLPILNIESLYALDVQRGWFSEPFSVRPSNNITIQIIGRAAQTERLGLLGYAIAKRSYLINQSP